MQIHELKRPKANKTKRPRVGRGGKRGYTSGRGSKGQKSRAGHKIRPAIRDLIQRLPKLRGYKNKSIQEVTQAVNLKQIANLGVTEINLKTLQEAGLVNKRQTRVKILGQGELKKAINVALPVSKSAKEKIEKAGGKIIREQAGSLAERDSLKPEASKKIKG